MSILTDNELLEEVKATNNITGQFHDKRVMGYIKDVKRTMAEAGIPVAVLNSDAVIGLIAMAVDNLMETGTLSEYVKSRIAQERLTPVPKEDS